MAYQDHSEAYEDFKARVLDGIRTHFPVVGSQQSLELKSLEVDDGASGSSDDIRAQHAAKVRGGTWSAPIYATLELKNKDGVVQTKRMRVAELPRLTRRYSYIIDGQEYQVDSQWQLKHGVYTRRRGNSELESRFNTPRKEFKVLFDPNTKQFNMSRGKAEAIPVYPLLKVLGVDDDTLESKWGKEVFAVNKNARGLSGAIDKFYRADRKQAPKDHAEAVRYFQETMAQSELDPSVTQVTLGKAIGSVDGDALMRATHRMLQVQAGASEDDRDSLEFKRLRTTGDYARDKLTDWMTGRSLRLRMGRQINKAKDIREIVKFRMLDDPIKRAFRGNSAARSASQINPLEMAAAAQQTTIMGPGGIQSERAIESMLGVKLVNPSHMGFLDPIKTPEGPHTGVTLRLPMGVKRIGDEAKAPLYNLKTGVTEYVGPVQFARSIVVLPDQVTWKDDKPVPISATVKTGGVGNKIEETKFKDAQYVMRHPSQLFSLTTNLIPFLGSDSGNRATYAGNHMEQSIGLKYREAPLVQVGTGLPDAPRESFEGIMGRQAGHVALRAGQVTAVKKDGIFIRSSDGSTHEVQLYNHFPLNDPKSFMSSTPLVKVGDKVQAGQSVADTNYTKDGKLALGTNLRVAYIPYKGYNFEDGVVISRSAADKLTSEHLTKEETTIREGMVQDLAHFRVKHPGVFDQKQFAKLDEKGVVKVGQRVMPGDPLIVSMTPFQLKDRLGISAVRRSLSGQHTDTSLRWKSDYPGEVVAVHTRPTGEIAVHIRTDEPMQVGDKISGRHGNKGICVDPLTQILTEHGWKYFYELSSEDRVCTLNQGNKAIEYQLPTRRIALDYSGKMYRFSGRRLSLMTTPNHNHYVRTARTLNYELQSAESCFGKQRVHLRTGIWKGCELQEVTIPGRIRREGSRERYEFDSPRSYSTDDFLEFFGYWLTEGCLGGDSHIHLGQRLLKNPETYASMRSVLDRLEYTYSLHDDGLVFSDPRLHRWLSQFGKAIEKFIPREFLQLGQRQLRILADAFFAGDGGVYFREKDNHTRHELFTSSPRLADDYQELAFKLGMSANIEPQVREDRKNIEYVVRWSLKDEVYTTADKRYESRQESWEDYEGKVYCVEVPNHVIYVRRDGIPVWTGNCTMILDDEKMPKTKDGKHIEVALNPSGVPGRVNVGQVLETAAAKVALKTGKPYIVHNFDGSDSLATVKSELAAHGLSDQEELIDPDTGRSLGKALVGPQYMLKLVHQVDKKVSTRSGMSSSESSGEPVEKYDNNLIPSGSGKTGAQSIGHNGLYTLLAHGATANIREMNTWKSEGPDKETNPSKKWPSQHLDVWKAIQEGTPLPTPRPTFAFQKFTDMLKGAGINIEKVGNQLKLLPFTDHQILALSNGEITHSMMGLDAKVDKSTGELNERRGGIFDPKITGGHGGKGWSHIKLPEPVPNPVFESAIRKLTGLKGKDYEALATGTRGMDARGNLVELSAPGALTGGHAFIHLLGKIDVGKDLAHAEAELGAMKLPESIAHGRSTQKSDALVKKIKYLRALRESGIHPVDAYVLHNIPLIPPALRPVSIMENGNINYADLNHLYAQLGQVVTSMSDPTLARSLTHEGKQELRAALYDGVKAVMGMDKLEAENQNEGILHQISGGSDSPKTGFFQQTLLKRKQDLTMRSTIIPEPALGLDEIGLPKDKALRLYKSFVVRKLVELGAARSPIAAQKMIEDKDRYAYRALELVAQERPVLIKRDPALHKHSVQAFRPKLVSGNAIQIHPLTTSGYNADFDGDTMSAYVPISPEAVKEAQGMFPSNNLYNEATGKVIYKPTLEGALGLYKLSRVTEGKGKKYASAADALRAVQQGKLEVTEAIHVGSDHTTPGRLLIASALPEEMRKSYLPADPQNLIDGKGLGRLFDTLAKNHRAEFATAANRLKDLGNGAAYGSIAVAHPDHQGPLAIAAAEQPGKKIEHIPVPTHSLGLDDFAVDHVTRDKYVQRAKSELVPIERMKPGLERDRQVVQVWQKTMADMTKEHLEKMEKNPTNLALMVQADVKPSKNQYRQMVLSPGVLEDAAGRPIPTPVMKSYAEGLDIAGYWTQSHGARGGTIKKVQEVRDPGYFSKQLMQAVLPSGLITTEDCGTQRGIHMHVGSDDVHDRLLAADYNAKGMIFPRGTILSPDIVTKIRSLDKDASLQVRSTLRCEHEKGVCQKCAGLSANGGFYKLGTNVGVLAAQSLGERSIQLTLKAFHSGGVSTGGGSGALTGFKRVQDLTLLPDKIPDAATVAMHSGTIDKMEHDATGVKIWIGGHSHHVGKDREGNLLTRVIERVTPSSWHQPKVGMKVEAGQSLSDPGRSFINPHDLYKATNNMERVQNFLTDELHAIYKNEGVRRQNIETVVRSMGELTKVRDPGDSEEVLRGEYRNASLVRTLNKELSKQGKRPIEHSPMLKGINVLPLQVQEDWMAKMMHNNLRTTVIEAAAMGGVSDIHGIHPVPAMAYAAEFGLTKKDSNKPGLGHLKGVSEYGY